jgi:Vacuolar 14 Fab1-binding region
MNVNEDILQIPVEVDGKISEARASTREVNDAGNTPTANPFELERPFPHKSRYYDRHKSFFSMGVSGSSSMIVSPHIFADIASHIEFKRLAALNCIESAIKALASNGSIDIVIESALAFTHQIHSSTCDAKKGAIQALAAVAKGMSSQSLKSKGEVFDFLFIPITESLHDHEPSVRYVALEEMRVLLVVFQAFVNDEYFNDLFIALTELIGDEAVVTRHIIVKSRAVKDAAGEVEATLKMMFKMPQANPMNFDTFKHISKLKARQSRQFVLRWIKILASSKWASDLLKILPLILEG